MSIDQTAVIPLSKPYWDQILLGELIGSSLNSSVTQWTPSPRGVDVTLSPWL